MKKITCSNCGNEVVYDEKNDYEIRCNNCGEVYCNEEAIKMKINLLNIQGLLNKIETEFKKINSDEIISFVNKNKSNPLCQLELLKGTVNDFINETKETKDTEYEDQYLKSIFGIFGVGDDYLNDDMKKELKELIDCIYEDGFQDGMNEVL